jgi:hypothetical protein
MQAKRLETVMRRTYEPKLYLPNFITGSIVVFRVTAQSSFVGGYRCLGVPLPSRQISTLKMMEEAGYDTV